MTRAYGASGLLLGGKKLQPMEFDRNAPNENEVLIDVLYCGVCHSDLHQVNDDWKNTIYPCVPGHEIIGRIVSKGSSVRNFKKDDIVGVGCMIDSCHECGACKEGEEQFCEGTHGATMTYNGYMRPNGSEFNTYGGYPTTLVVNKKFLLRIPEALEISKAAPILCAGITTYSPLKRWGVKAGDKVGIVGIGGLGHMAVKIARAMGAEVTAITQNEEKKRAAIKLGADKVLISSDEKAMKKYETYFNYILITIPDPFDINPYVCLLHYRGALVTVGLIGPYTKPLDNNEMVMQARTVGGSVIGGIAETQEVLDFCAEHNILPDVEFINMQDINEAFEKMMDEEVRFRYVIDMESLKREEHIQQ